MRSSESLGILLVPRFWRRWSSLLCGVYLASMGCATAFSQAPDWQARRSISITVQVRAPDNSPVAGIPVGGFAYEGLSDAVGGVTDASGNATLAMTIPTPCPRVAIRPTHPGKMLDEYGFCPSDPLEGDRLAQAIRDVSLSAYTWVPLNAEATSYSVTLTAHPATKVKGRVMAGGALDQTPIDVFASGILPSVGAANGVFELGGVRRGAENVLFVWRESDGLVTRVALTAGQCAGEITDIGDVVQQSVTPDADVRCSMTFGVPMSENHPAGFWDGTTFVSQDGSTAFQCGLDSTGDVESAVLLVTAPGIIHNETIRLPAGTYYISAGSITRGAGRKLWDLVRAGRQAELDTREMPKFTVVAGQVNTISFPFTKAESAIMALSPFD